VGAGAGDSSAFHCCVGLDVSWRLECVPVVCCVGDWSTERGDVFFNFWADCAGAIFDNFSRTFKDDRVGGVWSLRCGASSTLHQRCFLCVGVVVVVEQCAGVGGVGSNGGVS